MIQAFKNFLGSPSAISSNFSNMTKLTDAIVSNKQILDALSSHVGTSSESATVSYNGVNQT
jgi:hypothetical protein